MKKFEQTLIQITNNGMGTGDHELGLKLATNYLKLLSEEKSLPKFIALYNGGVKLLCEGSPAIASFKVLEERGVKIIACKTCLNHFVLLDKIKVGIAGTMIDIMEFQKTCDKIITL